jgi:hypothetical protein
MALTLGRARRYRETQLGTDGMKPMNEQHFAILCRHMVEVIGIHTDLLEEELGKAVLDERILTVMLRRGIFSCRNPLHNLHIRICRCRSGSKRPSPSRSCVRS